MTDELFMIKQMFVTIIPESVTSVTYYEWFLQGGGGGGEAGDGSRYAMLTAFQDFEPNFIENILLNTPPPPRAHSTPFPSQPSHLPTSLSLLLSLSLKQT